MNEDIRVENATPSIERCVTSYPARRAYRPGVVVPPFIPGVRDVVDLHCHAHEGQQDALALARVASENGMGGILFKTLGPITGEYRPGQHLNELKSKLHAWAEQTGVKPVSCRAGYGLTMDNKPPSLEKLRANLVPGIAGVWLPVFNHANTYNKVGARCVWIDPKADPSNHTPPMPWEDALRHGHYLLDDRGRIKSFYDDAIRIVADHNIALFFGHATHREIFAVAELLDKLNFRRGVIDHPFSPFVDLTVAQMKQLAAAGIYMNFTYDEISPLLGIDPKRIYDAIQAVGVESVTLSSDAGEPLFPHTVECMRLIRGYMEAFGLSTDELRTVCTLNPSRIVGLARS
jgi:hypothetical protein